MGADFETVVPAQAQAVGLYCGSKKALVHSVWSVVMTTRRKQRFLKWHPRGAFAHTEHEQPAHDPPLTPHDEVVFLLHVGAEVEHALLIQYLYAACSLKRPEDLPAEHRGDVRRWRSILLGIAR